MPRCERNALFRGLLATLVLSLFAVTGARSAPRLPGPPAPLPDRQTDLASLQEPAPPPAGQAGTSLPAVQQAAAPSESNAPSADTDRWLLDRVSWSEYTCRGENPLGELVPGQSRLHVACDRENFSIWDSYDLEGTMKLTYPMLLEGGKKAEFTLGAVGKMNWESSESRNRTKIQSHGELYAFLYGGAGNGYCERRVTVSTPSAVTGKGKAKLANPLTCEFDPAVDFDDGDEANVSYSFAIRVRKDDFTSGYSSTNGHVTLKYKRCPSPDDCPIITGKVYVPPHPVSSSLTQDQAPARPSTDPWPLIDVPVKLIRGGVVVDQAVTQAPDGRFLLSSVPNADDLALGVPLMHGHRDHPIYQVRYGDLDGPIASITSTLPTASGSTTQDIEFASAPGVSAHPAIARDHLDDLAVIYYHTHQAWELADSVGQVLDFPQALDIVAFSNRPGKTYWSGPTTVWPTRERALINIAAANMRSLITWGGRPDNREWHEFGHHVMADAFDNYIPKNPDPDEVNHDGYYNPTTTDSWAEGFAEFYTMMVARDIDDDPAPEMYRVRGGLLSLEANYRAFSVITRNERSLEELAVAGLLWDLVDPVDQRDTTTLGGTTYADCVQVDFADRLWDLLTTDWGDAVPRSDVAPDGYGYIFDVKHLYDVLKWQGIGDSHTCGGALTDLDELFIAHGFFADLGMNEIYEPGEQVGRAAWDFYPDRRDTPTPEGSYLAFEAVDDETGAPVPVQNFFVEVRFPPPHEHFTYSFRTNTAQTPGRLLFLAPDPQFQTTTYVTAEGSGYVSTEPLAVTNAFYYEQMASGPRDHFMEHTFDMERRGERIYLPMIQRNYKLPPAPSTGIFGRVTKAGEPAARLELDLERWDGTEWTTIQSTTTGSAGRYLFSPVAELSPGQACAVRYSNTYSSPNPGPGYLHSWSGELITEYQTGTALPGGDFDVADIVLDAPADGATVTLPAQFCWQTRSILSDNYVLYVYYPEGEAAATSDYLGHASCFTIGGLLEGWPSGAEYEWWVRAYQGQDPDSTPYNYGDSYGIRAVTIHHSASSQDSKPGYTLQPAPRGESDSPPTER